MKRISITVINDLATDQRLHRFAKTLSDSGYELTLVGRKVKSSMPFEALSLKHRRFKMIFTKGPFFYAFFNLRLFFFLFFSKKPDLLISMDLDTLLANYLISKVRFVPILYDSHEYFTEVPELIHRPRVKRFWENLERKILPNIKYAVTVSDSISSAYKKKYNVNFETIPNVSTRKKALPLPEFDEVYSSKYKIIYQGALNIGRGIELMIDSLNWIPESILIIAGTGDISKELQVHARKKDYHDRIFFTGRISPEELHRLTSQCDLGLSLEEDLGLSYQLALPNKLFDYVQARIPIYCSDLPEMASLIKSYEIGEVCDKRDPKVIAKQVYSMLSNSKANSEWQKKLEKAASELCWESEEVKLLKIVESALRK